MPVTAFEIVAGQEVMQYHGELLPIIRTERMLDMGAAPPVTSESVTIVVFDFGRLVGMAVNRIVDVVEVALGVDDAERSPTYTLGSPIVRDRSTLVLDVYAIAREQYPHVGVERGAHADGPRGRVLLADDSNAMRASTGAWLRAEGIEVLEVPSGDAALEELRTGRNGRFDAVITDLEMEGTDGFGVIAALQRERSQLPVIAFTHRQDREAEDRARGVGARACVNKLHREQLLHALDEVGVPRARRSGQAGQAGQAGRAA